MNSPLIITSEELKPILNTVVLVDVREPQEYAVSYIPNCKLIPLGELVSRAPKELDPQADIVIYCAHGIRSMRGLGALQQLGFTKLRSLDGGIVAWENQNGKLVRP